MYILNKTNTENINRYQKIPTSVTTANKRILQNEPRSSFH